MFEQLTRIQAIFYDFDGVMTDNRVYLSETGLESVACCRGDGLGVSYFKKAGILQFIISTETNAVVARRAMKLDIPFYSGADNKKEVLMRVLASNPEIQLANVVFVGNDVNDLGCIECVGVPISPADAEIEVKEKCIWVTRARGGFGVVRELMRLYDRAQEAK